MPAQFSNQNKWVWNGYLKGKNSFKLTANIRHNQQTYILSINYQGYLKADAIHLAAVILSAFS